MPRNFAWAHQRVAHEAQARVCVPARRTSSSAFTPHGARVATGSCRQCGASVVHSHPFDFHLSHGTSNNRRPKDSEAVHPLPGLLSTGFRRPRCAWNPIAIPGVPMPSLDHRQRVGALRPALHRQGLPRGFIGCHAKPAMAIPNDFVEDARRSQAVGREEINTWRNRVCATSVRASRA